MMTYNLSKLGQTDLDFWSAIRVYQ